MAGLRPVHFEIPANDPEAAVKFYTQLFGWKAEKAPLPGMDYWLCRTGDGPGIDGAIMRRMHPQQCVTNYVSVQQIDALIDKAASLGAQIALPKTAVPGVGWVAVALDPEGNPVGLWQDDKAAK
jgi:uncharacterized protein